MTKLKKKKAKVTEKELDKAKDANYIINAIRRFQPFIISIPVLQQDLNPIDADISPEFKALRKILMENIIKQIYIADKAVCKYLVAELKKPTKTRNNINQLTYDKEFVSPAELAIAIEADVQQALHNLNLKKALAD